MTLFVGIVVGLLMAAATAAIVARFSAERALDVCAMLLPAIAAVYAGSSLAGAPQTLVVEVTGVTAFFVVAIVGRWSLPLLVAVGYAAHGVWDLLHDAGLLATALPSWYGPFCAAYDWFMAAFVVAVLLRRPLPALHPA